MRFVRFLALCATPALAQQPLTLRDAVDRAVKGQPALQAAGEQVKSADARIDAARSGRLPKVNYAESFQRSDNPVFVFSSLLTQHQFAESNFAIRSLNRPDFLNHFQSLVTVDQTIWDGGVTKRQVEMARLGRSISIEDERRTAMNTIARVVETYFGVKLALTNLAAAREALRSAEADLQRAESVRNAGMSTDADVLSIRVHLANMREHEIRRTAELDIAWAGLNEALGLPLDTAHDLLTDLQPLPLPAASAAEFETRAIEARPEIRQARTARETAEAQRSLARAALYPQIGVRGSFEADRQEFVRKGGANWLVAATLRWNLFNGNADKARMAEAAHGAAAAEAQVRGTVAGVRLDVRRTWSALRSADERIRVASAAVAMAEESLRIVKNRYDAGMTTVTELLRNETVALDTRTRRTNAIYEQRTAAAALELAAGMLSAESEVLK